MPDVHAIGAYRVANELTRGDYILLARSVHSLPESLLAPIFTLQQRSAICLHRSCNGRSYRGTAAIEDQVLIHHGVTLGATEATTRKNRVCFTIGISTSVNFNGFHNTAGVATDTDVIRTLVQLF